MIALSRPLTAGGLGLGPASADRLGLPAHAPRALDAKTALRWLRAIQAHPAPRDRVLALLPFYAGLRVGETVALDTDDVRLSARKGYLRVRGKGTTVRELPIHPQRPRQNPHPAPRRPLTSTDGRITRIWSLP